MHEWGLTRALVRELTRVAAAHGAAKILTAKVRVSAQPGVSPEHLRRQFVIAAAGTVAEGAQLQIEAAADSEPGEAEGVYVESIEIEE
jgi:hydrogenase nickel incorporation protein HypA/HybF